jgi:ATP-dependent RNA helicase DeaD
MSNIQFKELDIDERIMRAVEDMGFEETTPIQGKSIPVILSGADMIGQAQTGTGKTCAFGIPAMQMVDPEIKKPQVIILSPTRELVIQIANELHKLSKYMHNVKVLPIYGGQDIVKQIRPLKKGVQVIVGTPGRVMDHLRRKTFKCSHITQIVLDEADEMLNMGFREDIETILEYLPEERQTVLFSATMPRPILEITKKYQHDAVKVKIQKKELTVENIAQSYYLVGKTSKAEVLSRLLDLYKPKLSLVFCNTKKMVDELAVELKGRGYFADGLHGDMKQSQRDQVMRGFRNGSTQILIATDVAARGIDVNNVEAVFNYDLPQDNEYYVHRIGRTGRAGKTGHAFSFIRKKEVYRLRDIERYCKTTIEKKSIPSAADVTDSRVDHIMDELVKTIEKEDISSMDQYIFDQMEKHGLTAFQIAAAFLKRELGETLEDIPEVTYHEKRERHNKKDVDRLFLSVGKKDRIKPGDIVGAIAGECKIPGNAVGSIDMHDNFTFVEIPKSYTDKVIKGMKKTKIRGNSVKIELSKGNRKKNGKKRR